MVEVKQYIRVLGAQRLKCSTQLHGINPILLTVSLRSAVSTDGVHWRCPVIRGLVAQPCLALGALPTFTQTALR